MAKPLMIIAAGGTGGHMFPASAFATEMKSRGWDVGLISDVRGLSYADQFPADWKLEVEAASPNLRRPWTLLSTLLKLRAGEQGILTVMCGGEQAVFERVSPIISAYARAITLIGSVGTGQLAKSVNQICIAGLLQGLSEGLHFAERAGLDIDQTIAAIRGGAAQSWQMENRWQTMRDGDYEHGFAVDWMRKDLRIALETASQNGASLPITAIVDQFYADIQMMGGNRWDTSSLLARLGRRSET